MQNYTRHYIASVGQVAACQGLGEATVKKKLKSLFQHHVSKLLSRLHGVHLYPKKERKNHYFVLTLMEHNNEMTIQGECD